MAIILNSFKQMLRKPGKALLFFVLLVGACATMVLGAGLYYISEVKMAEAKRGYTTIGTINQPAANQDYIVVDDKCVGMFVEPVDRFDNIVTPEMLDFPGADYVRPPENRPYYLTHMSCMNQSYQYFGGIDRSTGYIVEFTPLEHSDTDGPVRVRITKVLYHGNQLSAMGRMGFNVAGVSEENLEPGGELYLCRHLAEPIELETGKTYIGNIRLSGWRTCEVHGVYEFELDSGPFSTQYDSGGKPVEGVLPTAEHRRYAQEVTDNFYRPGGDGEYWLQLCAQAEIQDHVFPVLTANSLSLIPSCRQGNLDVRQGRIISDEEFDQGAMVCMVSSYFAAQNLIYEGDTINLPLLCALYGEDNSTSSPAFSLRDERVSLLGADGQLYSPFWEAEYQVVGIYKNDTAPRDLAYSELVIIPQKSIPTDRENIAMYRPMSSSMASFQIENGTIEQFDAALHANVPQAAMLSISYDDMGYTEMADSLEDARNQALLLLAGSVVAALAILSLLLYFFVVRERRRTAIERSLGMSKAQCRASIMAALMAFTVLASVIGGFAGMVILDSFNTASQAENIAGAQTIQSGYALGLGGNFNFSARYSPWAMWNIKGNQMIDMDVAVPVFLACLIAAGICLIVYIGAWVLIRSNIKIDPITQLSSK